MPGATTNNAESSVVFASGPNSGAGTPSRKLRRTGSLSKLARALTKGPRMLGRRVKHFLSDDLHVGVSFQKAPPAAVSRELATLELLAVYHRWLRGVQALLAIMVFCLSLMSFPHAETFVNVTIFVISQAAILVICKVYEVKAQSAGVTNVLFQSRNIFTSPFFFHMVAEIILWNIQTPFIVVFWRPFFELLNYFIFLRLYSVILYLNNAMYAYRTFCRALSTIGGQPLSTSFLLRTSLAQHRLSIALGTALAAFASLGVLYAKAEGVSVVDGLWFSFQTLATLGYGDITPNHVAGRAVAFIAWGFSLVAFAYVVAFAHAAGDGGEGGAGSANMHTLQRCHELIGQLRSRSARAIQVCWRLHRARRAGQPTPSKKQQAHAYFLSFELVHVIAATRRTRQALAATQRQFRETGTSTLTGLSPFQLYQHVYETHRAARRLQRVKDVDRVHQALRGRDVPASSLSRKDIADILLPEGSTSLSAAGAAAPEESFNGMVWTPAGLPAMADSGAAPPGAAGEGGVAGAGGAGSTPEVIAAVAEWKRKVAQLEGKCERLSEVLEALLAAASANSSHRATEPPSMSQSVDRTNRP